MLQYSHVFRAELVLHSSKLHVKAEFTETCPLADWCPAILSFQTVMDATLLNYICRGVFGLLHPLQWCSRVGCKSKEFLEWHPSVGQFQLSFSSGIPVLGCFN